MEEIDKKARNFFILGKVAEKLGMISESASNYFKALSGVNDFMLKKINLTAKNHGDRFSLLKQHYPKLYEITDKLFTAYRRTYSEELEKEELIRLRKNIEEAFKHAVISTPTDKEIEERTKEISKR